MRGGRDTCLHFTVSHNRGYKLLLLLPFRICFASKSKPTMSKTMAPLIRHHCHRNRFLFDSLGHRRLGRSEIENNNATVEHIVHFLHDLRKRLDSIGWSHLRLKQSRKEELIGYYCLCVHVSVYVRLSLSVCLCPSVNVRLSISVDQ